MRACRSWTAICLMLAACSSSPSTPTYSPPPVIAIPISAQTAPIFTADFTQGTFNVQAWCEQGTPVGCNPDLPADAIWTSFDRPGDQGLGCVGFGPNDCWQIINGAFVTKDVLPGFPIITRQTFDRSKPLHLKIRMAGSCTNPSCWAGEVWYDGESYWEGLYYSYADQGHVVVSIWTPSAIVKIAGPFPMGEPHDFDLIYDHATCSWSAEVDGVPTTVGAPANHFCLPDDPHVAVFSGVELLTVYRLQVIQ